MGAGHADAINTLKYSPDGQTLASGSADRHIFLWNAKSCAVSEATHMKEFPRRCLLVSRETKNFAFSGQQYKGSDAFLSRLDAAEYPGNQGAFSRYHGEQETLGQQSPKISLSSTTSLALQYASPHLGSAPDAPCARLSATTGPELDVRRQPNPLLLGGQDGEVLGRRDGGAGEEDEGPQRDREQVCSQRPRSPPRAGAP